MKLVSMSRKELLASDYWRNKLKIICKLAEQEGGDELRNFFWTDWTENEGSVAHMIFNTNQVAEGELIFVVDEGEIASFCLFTLHNKLLFGPRRNFVLKPYRHSALQSTMVFPYMLERCGELSRDYICFSYNDAPKHKLQFRFITGLEKRHVNKIMKPAFFTDHPAYPISEEPFWLRGALQYVAYVKRDLCLPDLTMAEFLRCVGE